MTHQKYLAFGDIRFRKLTKTLISLTIDVIVTKYFLIWLKKTPQSKKRSKIAILN